LLRTIAAQIIRSCHDLIPYVYDEFVKQGIVLSQRKAKELLEHLLQSSGTIYLILDGLDECEDADQRKMLMELANLAQLHSDPTPKVANLRILVCSRETISIRRKLAKAPKTSLTKQQDYVKSDIATFIAHGLRDLVDTYSTATIAWLKDELLDKAEGKFGTYQCA
jgi:Cdc6-like AAA superfamily ATPase